MAITADLHLNNNTYQVIDPDSGLYLKTVDSLNAFEWFARQAVEKKVDRVVIVGDIYQHPDPTEAVRRRVSPVLQMLASQKIQVVILTGNHDFCSKYHALESFRGWNKLVKILDEPFVENGIAAYVPHSFDIECSRTDFRQLIESLPKATWQQHIFFGHFSVRGAMRDNLSREEGTSSVSTPDIEACGATVAFLGHFHKYQRVKSNIPVFYCGSIENHRMEDMDGKRGFFIYDMETKEYERVDYDRCRPMHSLEVQTTDEAIALFETGRWSDAIVRIGVTGEHANFISVRNKFPDIKQAFSAAGGAHIYCTDKTGVRNKSGGAKVEIESIEQIDVMGTLKGEIDIRLPDDEAERNTAKSLLEEIYREESAK